MFTFTDYNVLSRASVNVCVVLLLCMCECLQSLQNLNVLLKRCWKTENSGDFSKEQWTHDKSHKQLKGNFSKKLSSSVHKSKEQFTQNRVNESSGLCDFKLNSFSRIPVLTPKFSFSGNSFSPLIFFSRHVHATFFTQASECLKALLSEDWAPRWRRHQKNFLLRYSACFYAGLFL